MWEEFSSNGFKKKDFAITREHSRDIFSKEKYSDSHTFKSEKTKALFR